MKKIFWLYLLTILGILIFFLLACSKDITMPVLTTAYVRTAKVSPITQNSAQSGGTIIDDGGVLVTAKGVCWSIGQIPSITDSITTDGTGAGSFTSSITGLNSSTAYYVRAYATNSQGTGYGNIVLFPTLHGSGDIVYDIDGNVYNIANIGTQIWMAENLKVTHYRNGDPIPNVTEDSAWCFRTTGAYCDYDNIPFRSSTYGKLYNYYTVVDARNLCPIDWHIPTENEWTTLTDYLGGEKAGYVMKVQGTDYWASPNYGATNNSGFSALPGGCRDASGLFFFLHYSGFWWTADTWYLSMDNDSGGVWAGNNFDKTAGFSVRCVKD